ncbi:uncharacterized protein [Clytia hemisphaerica]|uniref:uncharacterized protein n=1 Tax=Clytia hemisphaerica TaxID=252671 RepID=UPI0034D5C46C
MMGKYELVDHIIKKTLITKGRKAASDGLRRHYVNDLIHCLVEQPLSQADEDTNSVLREDVFIDLVVLPSSTFDKKWSNPDRAALMEQQYIPKTSPKRAVNNIFSQKDELVFVRGIGGIGKTTLLEMLTYKWAKGELDAEVNIDFVFKFTCRNLNTISSQFTNVRELFELKYPEVMKLTSFDDLMEISERVLIVIDGLDELKDLYLPESSSASNRDSLNLTVFNLINPKADWFPNHKVIACGRPKAVEFVKKEIPINSNRKNIEVCGFDDENVWKYIQNFFGERKYKALSVHQLIERSYNLRIMAHVPIFLSIICTVFGEDLIKNPINTQTELHFFTTLIFIRNHLKRQLQSYSNLMDIAKDKTVAEILLCLMNLSVTTYMKNKVVFSEAEIASLRCPIPLEETGFITKHQRSNSTEVTFQFRHLILHEYLTGLYISITKDITPFFENKELSSCKPTILGIQRMLKMDENELFLAFFKNLQNTYKPRSKSLSFIKNLFPKIFGKSKPNFEDFIGSFIEMPSSMIEDENSLIIDTGENDHVEFLTLYKESRDNLISKRFVKAAINITANYEDVRNIVNLMNDLNIKNIFELKIEYPSYDEYEKHLISLLSGEIIICKTEIRIDDEDNGDDFVTPFFECEQGELTLKCPPFLVNKIPEDLLQKSTSFNVEIQMITNIEGSDEVKLFIQRLSSYNTPITLSNIGIDSPYARTIIDMINDLNIKNIGYLKVYYPSYDEDEKYLISLVSGEEYETEIMIKQYAPPYFECEQGKLTLKCYPSLLNKIPEDLLQKSTSFHVEIRCNVEETNVINFLRHLTSFNKPITIDSRFVESEFR